MLDEEISEEEVFMAIHNIKTNTASGDDGIPPGVYKSFNEQLISLLTRLFNHVLNTREYPCLSTLSPPPWIRPCKLPESQFGFRRNRRTTDCIFILNALIEQAKICMTNLFICFVDFRKAFDSVDHSSLWNRLISLGISQ